ncbi:hypothetical protein evm_005198 [Chilo suppressalis]|nr:hypothetical protein evm_005198 [Chilo suppressalis]
MINGKKFYFYKQYTYCFGFSSRIGSRWRCSAGCKAHIVVSDDGVLVKDFGFHTHPPNRYQMTADVSFAQSQRGGRLLVYGGYSYSLQKFKNDVAQWKCTMVQPGTTKRCTAKILTSSEYQILDSCGNHNHRKPRFVKRNDVLVLFCGRGGAGNILFFY